MLSPRECGNVRSIMTSISLSAVCSQCVHFILSQHTSDLSTSHKMHQRICVGSRSLVKQRARTKTYRQTLYSVFSIQFIF